MKCFRAICVAFCFWLTLYSSQCELLHSHGPFAQYPHMSHVPISKKELYPMHSQGHSQQIGFVSSPPQLPSNNVELNVAEPHVQCPKTYHYSKAGQTCSKPLILTPEVICPKECEPDLKNLSCHCMEEAELQTQCPQGYHSNSLLQNPDPLLSDKLKRRDAYTEQECTKSIHKMPHLMCTDSRLTLVGDKCVGRKLSPPDYVCEGSSKRSGDVCVARKSIIPEKRCPVGFSAEHEHGEFRRLGLKDTLRGDKKKKSHAFVEPEIIHMEMDQSLTCVAKRTEKAYGSCPRGYRLNDGKFCLQEVIEPVDVSCAQAGYTFDYSTKQCRKQIIDTPNIICPNGYNLQGDSCVRLTNAPPVPHCRDGFRFDVSEGSCLKVLREPPRMVCEDPDYYYNGESCIKNDNKPSNRRCKKGRLNGDVCVDVVTGPTIETCPSSLTLDPTLRKCIGSRTENIHYECPHGSNLVNGNQCLIVEIGSVDQTCPDSFILVGNQCEKEVVTQASMKCPEPYVLVGPDCMKEVVEEPNVNCENDFQFDGTYCVLSNSVPSETICPSGFTHYKSKCVRQQSIPAESMCPQGFTLKGNLCSGIDEIPPKLACSSGFDLLSDHGGSKICKQTIVYSGKHVLSKPKKTLRKGEIEF